MRPRQTISLGRISRTCATHQAVQPFGHTFDITIVDACRTEHLFDSADARLISTLQAETFTDALVILDSRGKDHCYVFLTNRTKTHFSSSSSRGFLFLLSYACESQEVKIGDWSAKVSRSSPYFLVGSKFLLPSFYSQPHYPPQIPQACFPRLPQTLKTLTLLHPLVQNS